MKTLILILMAVGISGCSTFNSKWSKIEEGQTKDQVMNIMGQPDSFNGTSMQWTAGSYTTCDVYFSDDSKVYSKGCDTDTAALASDNARKAAIFQAWSRSQPVYAPTQFQPMRIPAAHTPAQTNCTTNYYGGMAHTNCSSY